jgi:hypothetical protein
MTMPHPSPRAYPSASLENVWHFPVGEAILADDKLMNVSGSRMKLTPPEIAIDISPEEKLIIVVFFLEKVYPKNKY